MRWWWVIAAATALAFGACTLFDGDPPDNTCRRQTDCFRAQGEHCEFDAGVCMPIDAAVIDAPPAIDAPDIDAPEIDAPAVAP
jgi:hypothetical protein